MLNFENIKSLIRKPWINIRLRQIFCILTDLFAVLICFLIYSRLSSYEYSLNYFIIIIIWILVSYFTGKYSAIKENFNFLKTNYLLIH